MKIVGFGDSFILGISPHTDVWKLAYQGMLAEHFDCIPEFRGVSGTGPWNMFFDFLNYQDKDSIDVVIMAWSEISRLYHPRFQPINTHYVYNKEIFSKLTEEEQGILKAAEQFYRNLYDGDKMSYELKALMTMVDEMSLQYKNTKFIHLPCFTWEPSNEWWGKTYFSKKPAELKYYHDFKHGAEVRPALMYMSTMDEWPRDLSEDKRECHMTPRINRYLADAIINCIEDFSPGKRIEIDLSNVK